MNELHWSNKAANAFAKTNAFHSENSSMTTHGKYKGLIVVFKEIEGIPHALIREEDQGKVKRNSKINYDITNQNVKLNSKIPQTQLSKHFKLIQAVQQIMKEHA